MAVSTIKNTKTNYDTLVNNVASNAGDVNTFGGRLISSYELLLVVARVSGTPRATLLVPRGIFTSASYSEASWVDSTNVQRWVDVKYVSDTQLNISCSSNATATTTSVYGIA